MSFPPITVNIASIIFFFNLKITVSKSQLFPNHCFPFIGQLYRHPAKAQPLSLQHFRESTGPQFALGHRLPPAPREKK